MGSIFTYELNLRKFLFESDTEGNILRAVNVTARNEPVITFRDSEVM
jgi:hypothetical protein